MADPKSKSKSRTEDPPDRHVTLAEMSEGEEQHAGRAIVHLVGTLRVLFHDLQMPALALAVAAADTLAEAGTYLIMLDQRSNHNTAQSREALRDVMRILAEFFDKQAAGVQFEAEPEHGEKGQVH